MEKIHELISALRPLMNEWITIHSKYEIWKKYWYKIIWNTITIILKDKVFDTEINKEKQISDWALNRMLHNIIKTLNVEVTKQPSTRELWYDDSLEWLFKHYPYGETNWSNVCLLWGDKRILWIQYNWCKDTSFIYSYDVFCVPNYIVLNNSKKLEWKYYYKDYSELEKLLREYYSLS